MYIILKECHPYISIILSYVYDSFCKNECLPKKRPYLLQPPLKTDELEISTPKTAVENGIVKRYAYLRDYGFLSSKLIFAFLCSEFFWDISLCRK